jgi:hypothetical protein
VLLGIIGAAGGSRVIRSAVIGVRSSQYLEAARVVGATDGRIMIRHVIPNIFGALMVQATIALGSVILVEATLSFLGFGVTDPDKPTWGQMLDLSRRFASVEPWGILWPARPSRSRCSASTCSATRCATCSTRGSAAPRAEWAKSRHRDRLRGGLRDLSAGGEWV